MKSIRHAFLAVTLLIVVCSCATTSVLHSSKSPAYQGKPVGKIAVLAVDDRSFVRVAVESHTAVGLQAHGQSVCQVREFLSLGEIKADKSRAAARLRAEGADSVLIMRVLDSAVLRDAPRDAAPSSGQSAALYETSWFDFYLFAYSYNYSDIRPTLKQGVLIESSLYDLVSEKRIWTCVTETKVKENDDKLELLKVLVGKIVEAMATDGVIR